MTPLALCACAHRGEGARGASGDADRAFEAVAADFLERYLALAPVVATRLGDHRHDGAWPLPWREDERARRELIAHVRAALARVPVEALAPAHRVDARILSNRLDAWTFELDELREPEWDPLHYTGLVGDGLDPLLTRDFAPLEERLASVSSRLAGIPAVLEAARAALGRPPRIHTETAIAQNRGLVDLVERRIPEELARAQRAPPELRARAAKAAEALRAFGTFLERELLPRSDGEPRLGRARFERKFRLALDTEVTPDELARAARALVATMQDEMVDAALQLWPELFPGEPRPPVGTHEERLRAIRRALDAVARDHPTDATVLDEARRTLREATAFVREKGFVTVPSDPVRVIAVPEYRRGIAVAYCDASGPLERRPETAVAISPAPAGWPRERVESFYREYNRAMLAETMAHEAMPGHYLQISHSRAAGQALRAILRSGTFAEGWAVYGERLMALRGFGGPRVRLEHGKLMIRGAVNALLDIGVHAGAMSEREATRLMTEEAFQEEAEAAGKWRRALLTSTQLSSYALGFMELTALRRRAEREPGFDERAYHDRLLSFGAPAPRDLPTLLFGR